MLSWYHGPLTLPTSHRSMFSIFCLILLDRVGVISWVLAKYQVSYTHCQHFLLGVSLIPDLAFIFFKLILYWMPGVRGQEEVIHL